MLYGVRNRILKKKKGGFFHCTVSPEECVTTRKKKNQLNYETIFFISPISKNIPYPGPSISVFNKWPCCGQGYMVHSEQR